MKRRTDNEKKSNKKKAVIAGLVVGISTVVLAFGLYMNYSKKDVPVVETNNPSIESVTENENPNINDVIKDSTQMDVKIEGVDAETEQSYSGVSDEDVGDDTGTQETTPDSIVESETAETTPSDEETSIVESETPVEETTETAKEETTQTAPEQTKEETTQTAPEETKPVEQAKESTEVQPVYKEETPAPSGGNGGSSGGGDGMVSQQDVDALFDSWGIEDGGSGYNQGGWSDAGITWE